MVLLIWENNSPCHLGKPEHRMLGHELHTSSSAPQSCVNFRALDEVTENEAELDRRPQSHGILEVMHPTRMGHLQ